jgi:hypothetical protein
MELTITNIINTKWCGNYNKYRVEIGVKDELKRICWLSEKQYDNLYNCFEQTPKGYSNGDMSVIGVFNEKGYLMYSRLDKHQKPRLFKEPPQINLEDLIDV